MQHCRGLFFLIELRAEIRNTKFTLYSRLNRTKDRWSGGAML